MKRIILPLLFLFSLALLVTGTPAFAQEETPGDQPTAQQGQRGDLDRQGWFCPWCGYGGGWGRGSGMGYHGYPHGRGMGPGMMHQGYGYHGGYGMMGDYYHGGGYYGQEREPLTREQASLLVQNYLRGQRNPNIKMGEITDKGDHYLVDLVTQEDSLVDKLRVDKDTGWFQSIYQ